MLIASLLAVSARGQSFTELTSSPLTLDVRWSTGASWGDYDDDAYPDLIVTHLSGPPNALYHNLSGALTRVNAGHITSWPMNSHGACWGDFDNDYDLDVFVTDLGTSDFLYSNEGAGTFAITERNASANERDCTWADYDNDGDLDLFLPVRFGSDNVLYRNEGGTFVRVAAGPIVRDGGDSNGAVWGDYDNDGDLDLFVTNAYTADFLYRNDGGGTFTAVTDGPIVEDALSSSGGSWGDYDNDGDLDLFVARALDAVDAPQANSLYRNNGDGTFMRVLEAPFTEDIAQTTGSAWADYDNDGDLDLFVANFGPNALYRNDGETFTRIEGAAPVMNTEDSSTAAWADADLDGDLDLVVTTRFGPDRFYVNGGTDNYFLHVRLVGTISNASAIGAHVRVKAVIRGEEVWQLQEVTSRSGRASQGSLDVEFGLGDATVIEELEVRWPSGIVQRVIGMEANQFLTVVEAEDTEPPTVTVRAGIPILWPVNHKYQSFGVEDLIASVSDDQDTELSVDDVVITRVTSDEPENGIGDGNTTADISLDGDCRGVRLRAERQGHGDGRVYTVYFSVADASGNISLASAAIHVPKNRGGSATDSGVAYDVEGSCASPPARGAVAGITAGATERRGRAGSAPVFLEEGTGADAQKGVGVPAEFALVQNFPNPFNSSTEITFGVPEAVPIRLIVYDLLGREVAVLIDGPREAGSHRVRFDAEGLPSGTYLYRLTAGAHTAAARMVVLE